MKKTAIAIVLTLAAAGLASAQAVPALINYQGKLTDASGIALPTGDYTLTLKVYDSPTNGVLVWGPQVFDGSVAIGHGAVVPVVQGHFNVMLGPVDVDGDSILTAFSGATRYLEVTVGAGSPILPRQQILSAPYAVTAANVRGANNVFPSSGNVGIGTTSPIKPLAVISGAGDWTAQVSNSNPDGYGLLVSAGDGSGATEIFRAALGNDSGVLTVRENRTVDVSGTTRILGTPTEVSFDTTYTASSDGHVFGYMNCGVGVGSGRVHLQAGVGSPSTTYSMAVCNTNVDAVYDSFSMVVPQGWQWRAYREWNCGSNCGHVYWLPLSR